MGMKFWNKSVKGLTGCPSIRDIVNAITQKRYKLDKQNLFCSLGITIASLRQIWEGSEEREGALHKRKKTIRDPTAGKKLLQPFFPWKRRQFFMGQESGAPGADGIEGSHRADADGEAVRKIGIFDSLSSSEGKVRFGFSRLG
ncbi:hypothetical protein AVEN_5452-1 [Araneus ventricosus]|uniref:Uncharacterized protein n=1 Tax=Araneus ventricosus TaxID=182803 RepID=A0A4Y2DWK9_ARAVE|nr:hypothetical protein AVEN_5452-1 [Araneus ventricosus]